MQKTKAQLEEELRDAKATIAKQTTTIEDTLKLDEAQRKELTIALGKESIRFESFERGMRPVGISDFREKGPEVLSWSQIFVEVGRLLEVKSTRGSTERLNRAAREAETSAAVLAGLARSAERRRGGCGDPHCDRNH